MRAICIVIVLALTCNVNSEEEVIGYGVFPMGETFVKVETEMLRGKRSAGLGAPDSLTTTPSVNIIPEEKFAYYDAKIVTAQNDGASYWRELSESDKKVAHKSLQEAHRLAVKIDLQFDFLFYGHTVDSVTIATGGFLYMSDFLHSFLTASQYIAPLMANFDTLYGGNDTNILYAHEDDAFIIQWSNVYLKDNRDAGPFSFQAQLYKDEGKIIAAYKDVPLALLNISTDNHPVKVGLSDAYYWDVGQFRTIYPYHTLNVTQAHIRSNSAVIYTHLQTCNMLTSCGDCMNAELEKFTCYWCSKINSCSDSYDRQRQKWVTNSCLLNETQTHCDQLRPTPVPYKASEKPQRNVFGHPSAGAIAAAFLVILALSAGIILGFILYGYRNPESGIGQFMIRNRPAELWRKFKTWKDKDSSENPNMTPIS